MLGTSFFGVDRFVRTVVEDDAVLQNLTYGGSFMQGGCLQNLHCAGCVGGYGAGKETSACPEAQFGGMEGVLHRAVG